MSEGECPPEPNHDYLYALQALGGYQATFAADTVLGAWLRQQPVMLKLGSVLFVHGGVSPQVAEAGLTVAEINQAMRAYWREDAKSVRRTKAYDAVIGPSGVTQYRGYFHGAKNADDTDIPLVNRQDARLPTRTTGFPAGDDIRRYAQRQQLLGGLATGASRASLRQLLVQLRQGTLNQRRRWPVAQSQPAETPHRDRALTAPDAHPAPRDGAT